MTIGTQTINANESLKLAGSIPSASAGTITTGSTTNKGSITGLSSATTGASAGYVMLFDATSAPSNGSVTPLYCYQLPANSTISVNYSPTELSYANGIVIEFSTTGCFTATSSNTAFFSAQVR